MARKKRRGGHRAKAIPVMPLIPVVAVVAEAMKYSTTESKIATLSKRFIGYDYVNKDLELGSAVPFWTAELVAIVGHKVANKVGINNMVRRATFGYLSL